VVRPVYGIIYDVAQAYGTTAYGIGLQYNSSGRSVQDWGMGALRFELFRFLRNVYHWNLLTDIQLDALVYNIRLQDWIQQDAKRGELTPFADGMLLWTVEEQNIPEVRRLLDEAGMFYGYEQHLLPVIQKYRCSEEAAAEYLRTGKEPVYTPRDPNAPSLDMETVLRNFGVGENEGEQEVLRVEEGGKLHKLTPEEIAKIGSEGTPKRRKKKQ